MDRRTILSAAVIGFFGALVVCILLGVMDVQCWDSEAGDSWNAAHQVCERP